METPEVGPGDLLLMRFNVIHATQSTDGKWIHPIDAAKPVPGATQASEDPRIAVALRTCDPDTPIDWHRVAASHTPQKILDRDAWAPTSRRGRAAGRSAVVALRLGRPPPRTPSRCGSGG